MSDERRDDGFEYQGQFYRWHLTDMGKDLMLIDRISGVGIGEFFEQAEESLEAGESEGARVPILLTLVATSIRAAHPDWSVDRIYRLVMNMSLGDIEIVDAELEEEPVEGTLPPPSSETSPSPPPSGNSTSPSNGSSPSSTQPASSPSETSSGALN